VTHRGPFQPLPFCDSVGYSSRFPCSSVSSQLSAFYMKSQLSLLGSSRNQAQILTRANTTSSQSRQIHFKTVEIQGHQPVYWGKGRVKYESAPSLCWILQAQAPLRVFHRHKHTVDTQNKKEQSLGLLIQLK